MRPTLVNIIASAACMTRWLGLAMVAGSLVGCATQRAYKGPLQPATDLAVIEGAPLITAGLPYRVVLRKVDETVVGFGHYRASVEPGKHLLLVDCIMDSPSTTSRFEIPAEFSAGGHYRLAAAIKPGNKDCESISIRTLK